MDLSFLCVMMILVAFFPISLQAQWINFNISFKRQHVGMKKVRSNSLQKECITIIHSVLHPFSLQKLGYFYSRTVFRNSIRLLTWQWFVLLLFVCLLNRIWLLGPSGSQHCSSFMAVHFSVVPRSNSRKKTKSLWKHAFGASSSCWTLKLCSVQMFCSFFFFYCWWVLVPRDWLVIQQEYTLIQRILLGASTGSLLDVEDQTWSHLNSDWR